MSIAAYDTNQEPFSHCPKHYRILFKLFLLCGSLALYSCFYFLWIIKTYSSDNTVVDAAMAQPSLGSEPKRWLYFKGNERFYFHLYYPLIFIEANASKGGIRVTIMRADSGESFIVGAVPDD